MRFLPLQRAKPARPQRSIHKIYPKNDRKKRKKERRHRGSPLPADLIMRPYNWCCLSRLLAIELDPKVLDNIIYSNESQSDEHHQKQHIHQSTVNAETSRIHWVSLAQINVGESAPNPTLRTFNHPWPQYYHLSLFFHRALRERTQVSQRSLLYPEKQR